MSKALLAACVVLSLCAGGAKAEPSAAYVGFHTLGISGNGRFVVGRTDASEHAAYWTRELGTVDLGVPTGLDIARAVAVSDGGLVVVDAGLRGGSGASTWLWSAAQGYFLEIAVPGMVHLQGACISRDGSTVGGNGVDSTTSLPRAFVWTAAEGGRAVARGDAYASSLYAISPDGQRAAGSVSSGQGGWAARWTSTGGPPEVLGPVAGESGGCGYAMTADGSMVVGLFATPGRAMIWTARDGMQVLAPFAPYTSAVLQAVSDDGLTAGGYVQSPNYGWESVVWRRGAGLMPALTYYARHGVPMGNERGIVAISANGRVICDDWWVVDLGSCGSADFDHDGSVGTDADIEAFFRCLAGDCCAMCDSADFNYDGDSGTDADIEAFFRVLAGGSC